MLPQQIASPELTEELLRFLSAHLKPDQPDQDSLSDINDDEEESKLASNEPEAAAATGHQGLSDAELSHFAENGWVLREALLSAEECAMLRAATDLEIQAAQQGEEPDKALGVVTGADESDGEKHTHNLVLAFTDVPKRDRLCACQGRITAAWS